MISMTGFAFTETQTEKFVLAVELKSYNNRYLDLFVTLPPALARWEGKLREQLASQALRGRVEFTVRFKEKSGTNPLRVDADAVRSWKAALESLRAVSKLPGKITWADLADRPGVLLADDPVKPEEVWSALEASLDALWSAFAATRRAEGARLEADIRGQLALLREGQAAIEARSADMEEVFRENLKRKFAELAAEVDDNRIATETAVLLMRSGVHEELVRLKSHMDACEVLFLEQGPIGKRLDFLCQEMGREINTIGSKTTFSEVQQRVVALKDALENIREQARNVE